MDIEANSKGYAVASGDIVSEEFDGELVVLDLASGKYYSMDGPASAVWQALISGASLKSIAADTSSAICISEAAIFEFAEKLVSCGCLARTEGDDRARIGHPLADAIVAADKLPTFEVFEDLAELIMADPIHDVAEEAGWPVRKLMAAE